MKTKGTNQFLLQRAESSHIWTSRCRPVSCWCRFRGAWPAPSRSQGRGYAGRPTESPENADKYIWRDGKSIPYLPTHEHVVAVGVFGIMRVRHSVERTHGQGELVQNVEVGLVFVLKRKKNSLQNNRIRKLAKKTINFRMQSSKNSNIFSMMILEKENMRNLSYQTLLRGKIRLPSKNERIGRFNSTSWYHQLDKSP